MRRLIPGGLIAAPPTFAEPAGPRTYEPAPPRPVGTALVKMPNRALARRPQRRRLAPRWFAPTAWVAGLGLVAGAVSIGYGWLERQGMLNELALAIHAGTVTASASIGMLVREIDIEGRRETPSPSIEAAIAFDIGQPILAFDPVLAKQRLESLSWIKSAAVERHLPGIIVVRMVERRPMALWQRPEGFVLIDRDGTPIAAEGIERFGALPVVVGDEAPKNAAALLDQLDIEPELRKRVTAIVWVGERRWNLRIDDSVDVRMPEDDLASAWTRLADLDRTQNILGRQVTLVDLRFGDRVILRKAPATPPQKPSMPPGKSA